MSPMWRESPESYTFWRLRSTHRLLKCTKLLKLSKTFSSWWSMRHGASSSTTSWMEKCTPFLTQKELAGSSSLFRANCGRLGVLAQTKNIAQGYQTREHAAWRSLQIEDSRLWSFQYVQVRRVSAHCLRFPMLCFTRDDKRWAVWPWTNWRMVSRSRLVLHDFCQTTLWRWQHICPIWQNQVWLVHYW